MSSRSPFDTAPKDRPIIAFDGGGDAFIVHYEISVNDAGVPYPDFCWYCSNGSEGTYYQDDWFTTWAEIPE